MHEVMDLTDLPGQARAATGATPAGDAQADSPADAERWRILVADIGRSTAQPLTQALERVQGLIETGRIDRASLLALLDEVESARRAGMVGQQLARLAAGQVRQSHEQISLARAVQDVLTERQADVQSSGCSVRTTLRAAEVLIDPTLLFGLLHAVVDWALALAQGQVHFAIDTKPWPVRARLVAQFHAARSAQAGGAFEGLAWRVLEHTAAAMGLEVQTEDSGERVMLTLEFPRTVNNELSGVATIELDQGFSHSVSGAKPLAGSHVLVVAARRDVRIQVRDAIRNMGLIVDFVGSVEEAVAFCRDSLPNGVIVESALRGDRFDELVDDIVSQRSDVVFIEIVEEGATFEISGFSGSGFARVGRDAIADSLPSALVFELSKAL